MLRSIVTIVLQQIKQTISTGKTAYGGRRDGTKK